MLYLDGVSLSVLRQDLENKLETKRINRIFQTTEHSLSLHFGKQVLVLSCNPQMPICYISNEKETAMEASVSSFLNSLRKHLTNSMLYKVEQAGWDRVLLFHFTRLTELGDYKKYTLIFELMGRNSNLFLCDENGRILDILKRFSIDEVQSRDLFPGATYKALKSTKLAPTELSETTPKPYYQHLEGVGKLLSEALEEGKSLDNLPIEAVLLRKKGKNVLFSLLGLRNKEHDEEVVFDDIQEGIRQYLQEEKLFSNLVSLRRKIEQQLKRRQKKVKEILKKIEKDEKDNANFIRWKEIADVLASVLYQIKRGDKKVEAFDFYQNEMLSIALDERKNPQENLEAYYKKYHKAKTTLVYAAKRKEELEREKLYLESLFAFVEGADRFDILKSIEEECIKAGYLKVQKKKKKQKKPKKQKSYSVLEFPTYSLFYGRNNTENDYVSFQIGDKEDYWFHVKDLPASHVILKAFGEVTEEMLDKACELAAFYSQAQLGDKVRVDYTKRKYLRKPKEAKPGFVVYSHEKSKWLIKEKI